MIFNNILMKHIVFIIPLRLFAMVMLVIFLQYSESVAIGVKNVNTKQGTRHFSSKDSGYITDQQFYRQADVYTVQKGDNIYNIAESFSLPVNYVVYANHLAQPYYLKVGQKLSIPALIMYVVKKGDTPTSIAYKFGINRQKLITLNNINTRNALYTGIILTIPARSMINTSNVLTLGEVITLLQQHGGFTIANPPHSTVPPVPPVPPNHAPVTQVKSAKTKSNVPVPVPVPVPPVSPIVSATPPVPPKTPIKADKPINTAKTPSAHSNPPVTSGILSIPDELVSVPQSSPTPTSPTNSTAPANAKNKPSPPTTSTNNSMLDIPVAHDTTHLNNLFPMGGTVKGNYKDGYWVVPSKNASTTHQAYAVKSGLIIGVSHQESLGTVIKIQINSDETLIYGNLTSTTLHKGDVIQSKNLIGRFDKKIFLSYAKNGKSLPIYSLIHK